MCTQIPKLFTHLSAHQPTQLQEVKSGENGEVVRHLGLLVNIVVLRLKAIGVEDIVNTQDAVQGAEGIAIATTTLLKGIVKIATHTAIDIRHRSVVEVATNDMPIGRCINHRAQGIHMLGTDSRIGGDAINDARHTTAITQDTAIGNLLAIVEVIDVV